MKSFVFQARGRDGFGNLGGVLSSPTARAQQIAIAAAHHPQTQLHQANGSTAEIVRLPGLAGDACRSEQNFGDSSIRSAVEVTVKRAKRQRKTRTLLRRKAIQGRP